MKRNVGSCVLEVVQGDITQETVEAIVNAANSSLLGGGGVDGAIHRAGGPAILEECRKLGGCATGDAKITTAGRLPSKWVIHTVGPVYSDGSRGEAGDLENCYRRSLEVAVENGARTVAFPAISCGVYGYPIPEAARIAVRTVREFVKASDAVDLVRFVLFSDKVYDVFAKALEESVTEA